MAMEVITVPIYRCTIEQHSSEMAGAKEQLVKSCLAEENAESRGKIETAFNQGRWYPWKYNEIVGWVCLEISGNKLTGTLWYIEQKVSAKLIKKRYFYQGKVFEVFLNYLHIQHEIAEEIYEAFAEWWKKSIYAKQRYLDIDGLRASLSFIDWPRVITTSNSLLRA
jgi:hypothetical protein